MSVPVLRLGTRRSALARAQSQWVADRIEKAAADAGEVVRVELVELVTHGDTSSAPLASFGGVGVFVSRLREALLAGEVDVAVHSLKDLPTAPAAGLVLAAVPTREDPRDVLVARDGLTLAELPAGARIGTGSPRRAAQLRALGLDLDIVDLRGNVDTRLRLVEEGRLDAVVLARAGLARLGRLDEATEVLDPLLMLPAPGQGALAVECRDPRRADGPSTRRRGRRRRRPAARRPGVRAAVTAERTVLATLEAGCAAPLGALAEVVDDESGPVLSAPGRRRRRGRLGDPASFPDRSASTGRWTSGTPWPPCSSRTARASSCPAASRRRRERIDPAESQPGPAAPNPRPAGPARPAPEKVTSEFPPKP